MKLTFFLLAAAAWAQTAVQRVHPVLIGNPHNELMEFKIDGNLQSVSCHFTGEAALEAVEILSMPDKRVLASARPARTVTFKGDTPAGQGVYWLSARVKANAPLAGRVSGYCDSAVTSNGAIAIRAATPAVSRRIGVALRKHGDDGVDTYRIPAIATSPKGTLLTVYDMRRRMPRDLQEDIDIGLSRSTDGGRTWESPRVIMDMGEYGGLPQEQNGCSDPGIIVDQKTGEIIVFAVWMNGRPGKHQWRDDGSLPGYEIGKTAQLLMVRSTDDGRTWSKPENLTRVLKKEAWWLLAPAPQQGINMPDGKLVMPMQGRDENGVPFATIMVSSDHGKTWTLGAPAHSRGNECQAARLSDGSIMLNIRNGSVKYRAVYVTKDFGRTWTAHATHANTLIEPPANGSLFAFRNLLLFANAHSQTGRTHHTLQVSTDDGKTWPEKLHLLLDEGRGRGYPSITQVDRDHIGIVYEGSRADMTFEKLSIKELLRQ